MEDTVAWLDGEGVPIDRLSTSLRALHPEVLVRNATWNRGAGTRVVIRAHGVVFEQAYQRSPVRVLHEGAPSVRVDLRQPEAAIDFEVCLELKREGFTDYLALPLPLGGQRASFASFATRAPEGFSAPALARLEAALRRMEPPLRSAQDRYVLESLLAVYLGPNAASRVLSGSVRRGTGEGLRAAIWACDLRGFTALAERRSAPEVVRVLDHYFDAVGEPIEREGGEILKFIGDAVLAVFPTRAGHGDDDACARALRAADAAVDRVAAASERLQSEGGPGLAVGIALHLGDVFYGNVGTTRRLDFTVIGTAVNEVSRVEPLCKTCGVPLLVTDTFRQALPAVAFASQGVHPLRGASRDPELFTLPRFVR